MIKYIPNILSASRIILALVLIYSIHINVTVSVIIMALAGITDFLDGFLARKLHACSKVGRILDAVSDKFFLMCAFTALYFTYKLNPWFYLLFALREVLLIIGLYILSEERQIVIQPIYIGKVAIACEFVLSIALFVQMPYVHAMIYVTLILSYISFFMYAYDAVNRYITPYGANDFIEKQKRICLVISSASTESYVVKTALGTFPHATVLNLMNKNMDFYKYEYSTEDDFRVCLDTMLAHDLIIFVTPVYWYSTTAQLKILFDRLADLLHDQQFAADREKFATKKYASIIHYVSNAGYAAPIIRKTCEYLGGHFVSTWISCKYKIRNLDKVHFQRKCYNALDDIKKI